MVFCLKNGVFSTDCLVIDCHVAEVLESAHQIEGLFSDGQLAQNAAVFYYLETELRDKY